MDHDFKAVFMFVSALVFIGLLVFLFTKASKGNVPAIIGVVVMFLVLFGAFAASLSRVKV